MAVDGEVINRMLLKAQECGGENGAKISRRFGLLRASWVIEQNTKNEKIDFENLKKKIVGGAVAE
jgi:hypothetical protein